jgi:hypothetical protein
VALVTRIPVPFTSALERRLIPVRPHPNQHRSYIAGGRGDLNTIAVVGEKSVGHKQCSGGVSGNIYAIARKSKNVAMLNVQCGAGQLANPVQPSGSGPRNAVNAQVAQCDDVIRSGLNHDAVSARHQHTSDLPATTIDCNTLRNCNHAETRGVEGIDFAAGSGFRDCSGKRLARRCPATRVSVIADAGDPRSVLPVREQQLTIGKSRARLSISSSAA